VNALTTSVATAALMLSFSGAAQAHLTVFQGTFAPEAPGATGSGTLMLEYDHDGHTLLIDAVWSGLSGTTTNAHIHCCTASPGSGTAGVALARSDVQPNILPNFPLGITSGSYQKVIDLTSTSNYSNTFLANSGGTAAGAEARLIANLTTQNAYFNIHTSTFGGGEIRAFVTAVPEPSTWISMLRGLGLVGGIVRRRVCVS
jgi:hypothetical protein